MKAVTVSFDRSSTGIFKQLLQAFTNSWRVNARIPLEIYYTKPPRQRTRSYTFDANHYKLCKWVEHAHKDTILIDSDMICKSDITDAFDHVQHIGITTRRGSIPYNGGVIFVKNTRKARAFIERWIEVDQRMITDPVFHRPWHLKYAGMNQSSLGWLLENGYDDLVTILPEEYNHCEPWDRLQTSKMIHIKSRLRRALYAPHPPEDLVGAVQLWHHYKNLKI